MISDACKKNLDWEQISAHFSYKAFDLQSQQYPEGNDKDYYSCPNYCKGPPMYQI